MAGVLSDSAVCVYTLATDGAKDFWIPRALVGEAASNEQQVPGDSGLLGEVLQGGQVLLRQSGELKREDYAHVDTRRTLRSLAGIPLTKNDELIGALEILCFGNLCSADEVESLLPAAQLAAGLVAAQAYEDERHGTLTSITRVTQLYDLEKVFLRRWRWKSCFP